MGLASFERRHIAALPDESEAPAPAPEASAAYLVFRICDRTFALPGSSVERVTAPHRPVPVPTAAPCIAGVIHAHGRLITIVDLVIVLGLERRAAADPRDRRLIVVAAQPCFGFLADAALTSTDGAGVPLLDPAAVLAALHAGARSHG